MPPYDPTEAPQYSARGTATVDGQAFLRQRGGAVVTCAGSSVVLMPDTAYFRELISTIGDGYRAAPPLSAAFVVRAQVCDAQGAFAFKDLPELDWIIMTSVAWAAGDGTQGGTLARKLTTTTPQPRVILSGGDIVRTTAPR